jgi:hypothetical protein
MISVKLQPVQETRWEIQKTGMSLNFEAPKRSATLNRFQVRIGKTANDIKGIIEKFWLD